MLVQYCIPNVVLSMLDCNFSALKENQDNLCQLPPEVRNFVGREDLINESKKTLQEDENFLIITGGPCYGKSSLANKFGREMFEKVYNYVIWISMRDISPESGSLSLEDVALKILQEFQIDTSEMKDDIITFLISKFECITSSGKTALLIFDNADDLIDPKEDASCKSSTYVELSRLIRSNSRKSIRAIFTTRVCKGLVNEQDQKVELGPFSEEESRNFLLKELKEKKSLNREEMIKEIVARSHGLPYALTLISSTVNEMNCKEMIEDYMNDLKENPTETVGENRHLFKLFDLSLKRLEGGEKELFSLLAVFPSRFSYSYVRKVSDHIKTVSIKPRMLKNLQEHSLVNDDSRQHESSDGIYLIHPFLREYMRTHYWDKSQMKEYETAFYKTYADQLFDLAGTALQKDSYIDSLEEFRKEQQNFFHVMTEIGKGSGCIIRSSYLSDVFKESLNDRSTPDFIASLLFCIDITNPSLLLKFFEGCETFAEGQLKKNIWCCRYDLNMKYFEKQIDDPHEQLTPDDYGKAVLDKREISQKIHVSKGKNLTEEVFDEIIYFLDDYGSRVQSLDNVEIKAYFEHKILKQRGTILKRRFISNQVNADKDKCIRVLHEALEICNKVFGENWLTIDCYNQLGKLYWSFKNRENAEKAFDNAIELAESMSLTNTKKFGSCLLGKGRFLMESEDTESVNEGVALVEDSLDGCKDFSDTKFWCLAMQYLLKVDKSKADLIKARFFKTDKLNHSIMNVMDDVIRTDMDSSDEDCSEESLMDSEKSKVDDLKNAIAHLEELEKREGKSEIKTDITFLRRSAIRHLFVWNMWAATRFNHVLLESERKEFAIKALEIMDAYDWIDRKKREDLESIGSSESDPKTEELIRQKHVLDRIGKKLIEAGKRDELMQRYSSLQENCEDNQELWSLIVCELSKNVPAFYEKVTPFLLRHSEPCTNLLKLIRDKFLYEIKAYDREMDENIVMEKSTKAVDDLKLAILHVEKLLQKDTLTSDDVINRLQCHLKLWHKDVALDADHVLVEADRRQFAIKARDADDLKEDEKKKLDRLIDGPAYPQPRAQLEQKQKRKKSLLIKMTKFMRQNDHQDELESRYNTFLADCRLFPRIRLEMVRFIINYKNVEIKRYGRYLQYLEAHFKEGTIGTGWDYQFVIDVMQDVYSNGDLEAKRQTFAAFLSIFTCLLSGKGKVHSNLKKKIEFEFLVAFSLKIGDGVLPLKERKENARKALDIDRAHRVCLHYKNLLQYKEQLERFIKN